MKFENEQNSFLHNMISDVYLHASGSELGSQLVRGRGKLLTNRTGEVGGGGEGDRGDLGTGMVIVAISAPVLSRSLTVPGESPYYGLLLTKSLIALSQLRIFHATAKCHLNTLKRT